MYKILTFMEKNEMQSYYIRRMNDEEISFLNTFK
ncbi:hypothetical protein HNQ03_002566 [Chryseobacterium sp. 16F]|uniref:Uncharacterized protein n=1 Tax=Frigoriflavimonas asaccharolytica TaxID=2735899 RepID=A0A8J8GCK5_9FLAO|nr:hypothetical protein [Frigoriflavimonas asaccharolytica]